MTWDFDPTPPWAGDGPCEPGSAEWQRRLDWFNSQPPGGWWWLSFADESGHLGIAIVPGGNVVQAASFAHAVGCNPGGEVAGYPLFSVPWPQYCFRLFAGDEAKAMAALEPGVLFVPGT